jgi:hypothetical protein
MLALVEQKGGIMDIANRDGLDSEASALANSLPKTALQAIYHAVTGKTESLKKLIRGNVVIKKSDIDRLHYMIIDQTNIYDKLFSPVSTFVVRHSNDKSITYSSWERFNALQVNNHELTSDITLKYEFVIKLPCTDKEQRCVVTVNIDSSLPVINENREDNDNVDEFGFFISVFSRDWRTVNVSIDFVDFLVAKSFLSVVEEWFSSLSRTPEKKFNDLIVKNGNIIRSSLTQLGRIGMAIFLLSYVHFVGFNNIDLRSTVLAVAIGMIIWATFAIFDSYIIKLIFKKAVLNIIPSVVILNDYDEECYNNVLKSTNSPLSIMIVYMITLSVSAGVNVFSSYLYSYLSGK